MEKLYPYVFYLALASILMLPLLPPGYYVVLDMQFGPSSFLDFHFDDFYGFRPSSYGAYFPLNMVLAAISEVLSAEIAEKLLLFSIIFLSGVSAHLLVPEKEGNARYFAGLLYMLNPFAFARFLAGHWSILLSYALWPLCLKFFLEFLEKPSDRGRFARAALLTTAASVSSHGVLILMAVYFLAAIFHFLKNGLERKTLAALGTLALAVLALNLFWIVPTLLLYDETYDIASPEAYFLDFAPSSVDMTLGASIATMHGFWRGGFAFTKDIFWPWPALFFAIALLAVLGAIRLLREKAFTALLFISIFLAGFILAFGEASPLSFVFTAFGESFPLYFIFRDSQKFVGLVCLSYAYLGAMGVSPASELVARIFPGKKALALKAAVAALCLIPAAYNFGIFFGFLAQVHPTNYPPDWAAAEELMSADPSDGGVLIIPTTLYNWYPWINGSQRAVGNPAGQFFSRPAIHDERIMTNNVYSDRIDPRASYISYLYSNREDINETAELLAPLNARYVLLLKNYSTSTHSLFLFKRRGGVRDITELLATESLYLLRNEQAAGKFLATNHSGNGTFRDLVALSAGEELFSSVEYGKITPARYRIGEIPGRYLVFTLPPGKFFSYSGEGASGWFRMASAFEGEGGGEFVNALFPVILVLFVSAWLLSLALLLEPGYPALALLLLSGCAVSYLAYEGILGPPGIGAMLMASFAISLSWKPVNARLLRA